MTRNQWVRKVREICRPFGYVFRDITSSGHLKLVHRKARTVFTSQTPSDHRVAKNLRSELRKALIEANVRTPSRGAG